MVNALLAEERRKRGLPDYARPVEEKVQKKPEGRDAHLSVLDRGRLRTMIARMVVDNPRVTNVEIVRAFQADRGIEVAVETVRGHRARMGLPSAPKGPPHWHWASTWRREKPRGE